MKEFDKAVKGKDVLPSLLVDFYYRVLNASGDDREDLMNEIQAAGFYLSTVSPLKREEEYWDSAYALDNLARTCFYKHSELADLTDTALSQLLFEKSEEILREGSELYPQNTHIKVYLASIIEEKNSRNKTYIFDEAISLLKQSIELDPEDEHGAEEALDDLMERISKISSISSGPSPIA